MEVELINCNLEIGAVEVYEPKHYVMKAKTIVYATRVG